MGSRTLLGVAGWLTAALVAVVVGLAAVRLIGEGLQGSAPPALSAAEVADALASAPAAPTSAPASTPGSAPSSAPASAGPTSAAPTTVAAGTQTFDTPGGLVTARCAAGVVTIAGTSPAQGWGTHEVEDGADEAEVDFRSGRRRVEVTVTCGADGRPVARTEDKSDDD
ncbi:hypothetical protein [Spirilliplanes yamanashiensis]|uniref:Septum formation initiator n=1 Tax=Spirilliplanes yamanashiensis TaxID=42233 RepID=A0A8J3Y8U1_9ACTN|nr:hypothetical protein [Spirilliplanes yamanashiensis]MDP9817005.1 hypothetical protein [Spirilliplanes yamanashiensis]GIJ03338.1 hypothetical protein Sya03_26900 [Spirilliplanes yamanashiensis]